ncbi:MAG: NYN domain-containing protein [Proteobacteria bacterium]|nr:NYN domain-containing protein [Pseudomonadota bacterium]
MTHKRAVFYIDGFNFYYLRLKDNPHIKWLNLKLLGDQIVPYNTSVVGIKYFTADVSRKFDAGAPSRQKIYFSALNTVSEIEIIKGRFAFRKNWATLANPLETNIPNYRWNSPKPSSVKVNRTEEKGSDVNLASHLVLDACQDKFDIAYVITNDTDLIEPIRIVSQVLGKEVVIVAPKIYTERTKPSGKKQKIYLPDKKLKDVATSFCCINEDQLQNAQFPDIVIDNNGNRIHRLESW